MVSFVHPPSQTFPSRPLHSSPRPLAELTESPLPPTHRPCLITDVQTLRIHHHICGVLSGTLPEMGQQNVFLGLPLVLLPEEVVLLVRHSQPTLPSLVSTPVPSLQSSHTLFFFRPAAELAVLISSPAAHVPPTPAQASHAAAERAADVLRQRTEYAAWAGQKALQVQHKFAAQIDAKRKQRESARATAPARDPDAVAFTLDVPAIPAGAETTPPPAAVAPAPVREKELNLDSIAYTITIQASSTDLPWFDPDAPGARFDTLADAAIAGVWNYPEPGPKQVLQESRCRVFEGLWRKGYFLGGGIRFGGDFLVYPGEPGPCRLRLWAPALAPAAPSVTQPTPRANKHTNCATPPLPAGDPLRYHSHFTLTVLATPVSAIMPLDLVAYGRLATAVKKAHLLASWDPKAEQADFFSLEWAAFG